LYLPNHPIYIFAILLCCTSNLLQELDITRIHFKPIPEDVIEGLIQAGDWAECAGGLRIEAPAIQPYLISIEGTEDSVMGLSKMIAMRLLLLAAGESN
jgi:predicted house-cleaning NTP pyrophosphatase (Maf/HAM1 superfamily)